MSTSATVSSTPRLSEAARHVVIPAGIVTTAWPRIVAKAAEMGVEFDPWQHGAGSVALGKRKDGKYAATVGGIVLSIPRQVGKTFWVGMIMIVLCVLNPGFTVLWTAHRTRTASMTFNSMQGMVRKKKIWPHVKAIRSTNGEQEISFRNGSVIMFGAREQGFGRGFDKVDAEVFDEAQILTAKALEDMVPAANQSQQPSGALLFFMGTPPRPSDPGEEFTNRRSKALSGKAKNIVYVEFSADDGADPDDRKQWAKANPSFPARTPVESIERMREQLTDDDSFRREGLGIWDPTETARVIDEHSWSLIADASSMAVERLSLAIDVPPDRKMASVSLAGMRPDGRWHVELDEQRKGVDWVIPWIEARVSKNRLHAVVVDEMSGLVEKRRDRNFLVGTDVEVTLAAAEGRDMAIASAKFFDSVIDGSVRHTDQPQVNVALSVARKRPLAGGWAWNRKDAASDITPIVSATLALWGAQNDNVKRPVRRSGSRTAVVL
ncbi:phage terminase large subunit-like protein [Rathayibacter sp. PhB127]|uniref:terminase n=1 Tax=Rathayibacter sp. PhB127 TaxID=2485176 RepID=UPI000F941706|nr:terminase [Rathayibacter sp. PhB127]ROS28910.1 phage terminase large subunit-like protein [Rathayibacter sp. PhB127]